MRRAWWALVFAACGTPAPPPTPATPEVSVDTWEVGAVDISDVGAVDTLEVGAVETSDVGAVDSSDVGAVDSSDVGPDTSDVSAAVPLAAPTRILVDDAGALAFEGFPGISADGMHVAYVLGDATGPLRVRVARLDDAVLKDEVVLTADERARAADGLARRLKQRAQAVERLLGRAGMRGLVPLALDGMVVGGQLTLRLPGYAPVVVPDEALDRRPACRPRHRCAPLPCRMAHRLVALWASPDNGVVLARLEHLPSAACPAPERDFVADDWRVFPLPPAP